MVSIAMMANAALDSDIDIFSNRLNHRDRNKDPGIAEWRAARGGVYTITVAEMIEALDKTLADQIR